VPLMVAPPLLALVAAAVVSSGQRWTRSVPWHCWLGMYGGEQTARTASSDVSSCRGMSVICLAPTFT